ncbi:hypothetical protein L1887_29877 [Cichorium endivia]|nr:hypothetical protein L1887_29877 [Cichorium endivia]
MVVLGLLYKLLQLVNPINLFDLIFRKRYSGKIHGLGIARWNLNFPLFRNPINATKSQIGYPQFVVLDLGSSSLKPASESKIAHMVSITGGISLNSSLDSLKFNIAPDGLLTNEVMR